MFQEILVIFIFSCTLNSYTWQFYYPDLCGYACKWSKSNGSIYHYGVYYWCSASSLPHANFSGEKYDVPL